MRDIGQTFIEKLHECNQHKKRLIKAKDYLKEVMPLDVDKYNNLNEIQMSFIDQMIFRFSNIKIYMSLFDCYLMKGLCND